MFLCADTAQSVIPRAAALVDAGALTDVTSVVAEDTFTRPIYAGNAIATVRSADKTKAHKHIHTFTRMH